jgi:cysteine desulfurase
VTVIYLDHNATTPLDPAVREEMLACLEKVFGNPSSIHSLGQEAKRVIDKARARVARFIGAQPEEIIFTSGGTEANNLAIMGAVSATRSSRPHVITTAIEHQAVLNPCRRIEQTGGSVTFLAVDREGLLDPASAAASLQDETVLASVMLANNDIGTVQPVATLSAMTRERGVLLHTDAVQAVGKLSVNVKALGVDLLSLSAHKLHGPQGAGALYIRKGTRLSALAFGGHQERGLRPGTENVAAIAGFGKACELAATHLVDDAVQTEALRSSFETSILDRIPATTVNGQGAPRLPNTSNVSFEGIDGEVLTINLDLCGIAVSTGAACSAADHEPSHVLIAMGRTPVQARSSVRFSFGRGNTREDMLRAVDFVVQAVVMMRKDRR